MTTKPDLGQQITCRCLKTSVFEPATDISGQLADPDQRANMETFLNVRIAKWLRANQPGWSWKAAVAQELGNLKTMGDFEAYVEAHLVALP